MRFHFRFKKEKQLVFIYSSMRCGSTLLKALLGQASGVSHLPEINIEEYSGNGKKIAKRLRRLSPEKYIVIKRPAYFECRTYPPFQLEKSKKIILVRNPHDTIVSLQNMLEDGPSDNEYSPEFLLDYWEKTYSTLINDFSSDDQDVIYIKYEDLLARPMKLTSQIFSFMGLKNQKGLKSYQKPDKYIWRWGQDDEGEKIFSLKVQPPEEHAINPEITDLINKNEKAQKLCARFGYDHNGKPKLNRPRFFILGTQKGGTTSFLQALIQHPDIAAPTKKEVHYFDLNYHKSEHWYLQHFSDVSEHQITGEASPYYLYHPLVPARMFRSFPEAKLIILLRDPFSRTLSHYKHEVRLKYEKLSFAEALVAEQNRIAGEKEQLENGIDSACINHQHFSYIDRSRYTHQIARWHRYFREDQMLIIKSEDLFAEPANVLKKAFDFLELEPFAIEALPILNSHQGPQVDEIEIEEGRKVFDRLFKEELIIE